MCVALTPSRQHVYSSPFVDGRNGAVLAVPYGLRRGLAGDAVAMLEPPRPRYHYSPVADPRVHEEFGVVARFLSVAPETPDDNGMQVF